MKEEQLLALIEKYLDGTATKQEKQQLDQWYREQSAHEAVWHTDSALEEQALEERMLLHLYQHIKTDDAPVKKLWQRNLYRYAAAIFLGVTVCAGYLFITRKNYTVIDRPLAVVAPTVLSENRFVVLPDSSTVVLHSGSSIRYALNGGVREVHLKGEAFFDVKHMTANPFVIYAGNIKTTVLGTAFNIKANYGQQVVVSVSRGKVSVSDAKQHLLATLLPNQQLVYNAINKKVLQGKVEALNAITWAKSDMQFEDMPFKQLAERLSRRYNVSVNFKSKNLEKCLITGRFNGTETLNQVLQALTGTIDASFATDGKTVTLDGAGCN
jgi:ferric-dicitrate binding protein FerR (iron transport regulator)